MHRGVAAPDLGGDGLGDDTAVFHDVIETRLAAFVLPDGVRADEPGASAGREGIVREAEPVGAEVGTPRNSRESSAELFHIRSAVFHRDFARVEIRRVAGDGVGGGPRGEEGVGADDVRVEIVERERLFLDEQLVGLDELPRLDQFEFLGEHEGDFGQLDGEGIEVDAVEILQRDGAFERLLFAQLVEPPEDVAFEALDLAIGDEEEIAGAARRIEDAEAAQGGEDFAEFADVLSRGFDALAPRADDGGADDFLDVELAGEVGAEGVARFGVHAVLEEGAEDFGLHLRPVVGERGVVQGVCFGVLQLDGIDGGEEAAIEVIDPGITPAARGLGGGHLAEEAAEEVVAAGGFLHALGEERGDDLAGEQPEVFGDDGDEELKDEALGAGAVLAAGDDLAEDIGDGVGGLAGDFDAVVAEDGLLRVWEEEVQRGAAGGEVAGEELFEGVEELGVEVVDPEFVEVAEDDVGRAAGDDVGPVIEGLVIVLFEVCAARFHLDEDALGPEAVGEFLPALRFRALAFDEFQLRGAGLFRDAKLQRGTGFLHAAVAERAEEVIEEKLGLALLIALQRTREGGELCKGGLKFSRGHGRGGCRGGGNGARRDLGAGWVRV